jgi:hypothetical protein
MGEVSSFLGNALPTLIGGIAVYVGIRVDLARLHERIDAHAREIREAKERAERAHSRIDDLRNRS